MKTFLPDGIGFLGLEVIVMGLPNCVSNALPDYSISFDHLSSLALYPHADE